MVQELPNALSVDVIGYEVRPRLLAGERQAPEVSDHLIVEVVDLVLLNVLEMLLKPLSADLWRPGKRPGLSFSRESWLLEQTLDRHIIALRDLRQGRVVRMSQAPLDIAK